MKGVVYSSSLEVANAKLQEVINDYTQFGHYAIIHERHFKHGNQVVFDNGDAWESCALTGYMCGKRYNIAYIDHLINTELIDKVIMPSLALPPYQAYNYF